MKKLILAGFLLPVLAACGGGGGSTAGSDGPVSLATPPASAGAAPSPQVLSAPSAPASAMKLNTGAFNQGSNGQDTVVSFNGSANLTLSGQLDRIWLNATLAGGSVMVSGSANTVVFMPAVDTAVTVTGTGNTFYLPVGSPIKMDGAGLASSTINYYKP